MQFDALFLRAMSSIGITTCFGIIGSEAEAIRFDKTFGITFYLTRHEFAAGIMADVAGRLTGIPHMCWATFDPGVTNMATGVCSAMLDRSPMVACSAQIPRPQIGFNLTHQCIDNVGLMAGITKSSRQLEKAEELGFHVQTALQRTLDSGYRTPVLHPLFKGVDLMILIGYDFGEDLKPALWGNEKPTLVINSVDVQMSDITRSLDQLAHHGLPQQEWLASHQRLKRFFDQRQPAEQPDVAIDIPRIVADVYPHIAETAIDCHH